MPWKITWCGFSALVVAILLGLVLELPFIIQFWPVEHTEIYLVDRAPADDAYLSAWARSQPSLLQFEAERNGDLLVLHYMHRGFFRSLPFAWEEPFNQFGYMAQLEEKRVKPYFGKQFSDPYLLLPSVFTTQCGLFIVGWWNIRRASRKGEGLPHLHHGPLMRAFLAGLGGALLLFTVAFLNGFFIRHVLGCCPPRPWKAVQEFVPWARVSILLFAVVVSPIAEEVFFRGYLFAKFKREGHIFFGMVTSALLFAALHFHNPYNLGAFFGFGLILAWLYYRTGSLLSCITAHAANNGLVLLLILIRKC